MRRLTWLTVALVFLPSASEAQNFERWQSAMDAFAKQDAESPPAKNGTVFVGSSSIRKWNLAESFPNSGYLNRGFGGSQIADSTHFIDVLILKHRPKVVVMYAGDNDVAAGKSPERVAQDFAEFAKKLHAALPETKLYFIAIKPSLKRWNLYPKMKTANQAIAKQCAADPQLTFVDIAPPMLGKDGKPIPELFAADGLHLSPAGYRIWTKAINESLGQSAGK